MIFFKTRDETRQIYELLNVFIWYVSIYYERLKKIFKETVVNGDMGNLTFCKNTIVVDQ